MVFGERVATVGGGGRVGVVKLLSGRTWSGQGIQSRPQA